MTITTKTLSLYLHSLFCWNNYYFYLSCGTLGIYISMTPNDFLTSGLLGGHPFLQTGWLRHHEDQSYELYLISGSHRDHPWRYIGPFGNTHADFYLSLLSSRNTLTMLTSSFLFHAAGALYKWCQILRWFYVWTLYLFETNTIFIYMKHRRISLFHR